MPSQSTTPGIAARSAPTMPAPMFQNAAVRQAGLPVNAYRMSKASAATHSPRGRTTSIGWIGCLPSRAPLRAIAEILRRAVLRDFRECIRRATERGLGRRGRRDGGTQDEAERNRRQHDETDQGERERDAAEVADETPHGRRQRGGGDGGGVVEPVG